MDEKLNTRVDALINSYLTHGGIDHIDGSKLPQRSAIIEITRDLLSLVFPGYFNAEAMTGDNMRYLTGTRVDDVHRKLCVEISRALRHACARAPVCEDHQCEENATRCAGWLIDALPNLRRTITTDIEAAYKGDPACYSHEEAIICYPGVRAVAVQRIAHVLHCFRIPLIPRVMTEYTHHETGVDIHPGATLGDYFFIDHATGVVIGETCVIGKNVKLYQGVTLGAKSFPDDAREIRGATRHPTIEDDVVIYANSTILGDITIGKGSTIGGNTWITHDVAPHSMVVIEPPKLRVHEKQSSHT
jgi:serine O-acetyltransferase